MLKGNQWSCIVKLADVKGKDSSTLVGMKDCDAYIDGQEEVFQAVHNLRPWERACLTRMGSAFDVDL